MFIRPRNLLALPVLRRPALPRAALAPAGVARAALAVAALALPFPSVAAAGSGAGTPTRAQVHAAVLAAERSRDLWATVNICNTTAHPNTIGVRGQMPALSFPAQLQMIFTVDYWSPAKKAFEPVSHLSRSVSLGKARTGLHQGGVSFTFSPHAGLLRGHVRYRWWLGHRLIGHATRVTRRGHPTADDGEPVGFSSGNCLIP